MQVMLMRLMSKGEYLIVPKGTKFMGSGKLGLNENITQARVPHHAHASLSHYTMIVTSD